MSVALEQDTFYNEIQFQAACVGTPGRVNQLLPLYLNISPPYPPQLYF